MRRIKFEIVVDNPRAVELLLDAIRAIMREENIIKLEISEVMEEIE